MNKFDDLYKDVPLPGKDWVLISNAERIAAVANAIGSDATNKLVVCRCEDNGYVYFELSSPMSAAERGIFLLDIETVLKERLDEGLTVWHMPQGDKSSLRRLRGVGIKS